MKVQSIIMAAFCIFTVSAASPAPKFTAKPAVKPIGPAVPIRHTPTPKATEGHSNTFGMTPAQLEKAIQEFDAFVGKLPKKMQHADIIDYLTSRIDALDTSAPISLKQKPTGKPSKKPIGKTDTFGMTQKDLNLVNTEFKQFLKKLPSKLSQEDIVAFLKSRIAALGGSSEGGGKTPAKLVAKPSQKPGPKPVIGGHKPTTKPGPKSPSGPKRG